MKDSVLTYLDSAVSKYADRIVYSDENSRMTFSELNHCTMKIGTWIARILEPGRPVAVMTGRHVYTPACYLGVVRAGCFYAPMDASVPVQRLNQILGVIDAQLMLVDREHLEKARGLDFGGTLCVMEDILEAEEEVDNALLEKALEGLNELSPLYVIFTSGSTGVPKGVTTSHHSLMCYIEDVQEVLQLTEEDVLGSQSPLDYIAAIRDIYLPLRTGASTHIIPKNEFAMPTALFETLNRERVTTLCWSVAGIELPARLGAFDCMTPQYLKRVIFSGSVLRGKYLKVWQQHLPDVVFINQYGPTEATASCTYYIVQEKAEDDTVLPIGVPYGHYSILLLDEDGRKTVQGEVGEICVGGPCLALGYYGDSSRTEASFIQNPLNSHYRELIYRTGDLGRLRADGMLEFCGRKDRQIKHMGHRVELEELEAAAAGIEGVAEVTVLYDSEKELIWLFYTGTARPKDIVMYFRANLPAFMVPRKVLLLDEMPVLPNGKTDMQRLKQYFK